MNRPLRPSLPTLRRLIRPAIILRACLNLGVGRRGIAREGRIFLPFEGGSRHPREDVLIAVVNVRWLFDARLPDDVLQP